MHRTLGCLPWPILKRPVWLTGWHPSRSGRTVEPKPQLPPRRWKSDGRQAFPKAPECSEEMPRSGPADVTSTLVLAL